MNKYGIDLGTTNSAISVYIGSETSKIVTLDNGKNTMPSCILLRDGEYIVGDEAYKNRASKSVVYSAKRHMGTSHVFTIVDEVTGEKVRLTPEEVGAEVIKGLIKKASYLYSDVKDVTITVPADFNDLQRKATQRAGELAGLNVVAIINEPTSAALAYKNKEQKTLLIYDLGGGTFDVSVVEVIPETTASNGGLNFAGLGVSLDAEPKSGVGVRYNVLANEGDTHLGGDDIDKFLANIVFSNLNKKLRLSGLNVKAHKDLPVTVIEKVIQDIESTKKTICANAAGMCKLYIDCSTIGGGTHEEVQLTSNDFVEATRATYLKTELLVNNAVVSCGRSRNDIDEIVLVGGSTLNLFLQQMLDCSYPDVYVNNTVNPDECVAVGASKQTAMVTGESESKITDVMSQSICVETMLEDEDGYIHVGRLGVLIPKNTRLPYSVKKYYEVVGGKNETVIRIYQGEGQETSDAVKLGDVVVTLDEVSDGVAEVTATVNTNGVLEVSLTCNGVKVVKQLVNYNSPENAKPKSVSDKLRQAWYNKVMKEIESCYKRIPKKLIETAKHYLETGDMEAKDTVMNTIKAKKTAVDIEKTKLFE